MSRMESLPNSVNYGEPLSVLPDGMQNFSVSCPSVNGSTFGQSSQIIVDLNSIGYLDPASLMIRYNVTYTTGTSAGVVATTSAIFGAIAGCPLYAPISRLDVLCNSNIVESINSYNSVATMLSNLQYSTSSKLGMQTAFGYADSQEQNENTDGAIFGLQGTGVQTSASKYLSVCGPLPCLLSNAEKLIPLEGTNIRLQFSTDSIANFCPLTNTANVLAFTSATKPTGGTAVGLAGLPNTVVTADAVSQFTSYTISNFEVVYNQVQFPPHINAQIKMENPKIRIKTTSYATAMANLASGSSGTTNLVYNLRYASIKGLFMQNSPTTSVNKNFESYDITRGGVTANVGGTYNFNINGMNYPQNPINTALNKSYALQELRRAMNNIYNDSVSLSINANEFGQVDATTLGSNVYVPAKFYVAVNTQRLSIPSKSLFTGISSQNSPITYVVNIGTVATSQNYSCLLTLYYDAILEIDTQTKQVSYIY
jgi:hypothetical protein